MKRTYNTASHCRLEHRFLKAFENVMKDYQDFSKNCPPIHIKNELQFTIILYFYKKILNLENLVQDNTDKNDELSCTGAYKKKEKINEYVFTCKLHQKSFIRMGHRVIIYGTLNSLDVDSPTTQPTVAITHHYTIISLYCSYANRPVFTFQNNKNNNNIEQNHNNNIFNGTEIIIKPGHFATRHLSLVHLSHRNRSFLLEIRTEILSTRQVKTHSDGFPKRLPFSKNTYNCLKKGVVKNMLVQHFLSPISYLLTIKRYIQKHQSKYEKRFKLMNYMFYVLGLFPKNNGFVSVCLFCLLENTKPKCVVNFNIRVNLPIIKIRDKNIISYEVLDFILTSILNL
ncbi:hypothetical protein AGLY_015682 [Aphis glycines]|uniref:Uncharacterized protein n=1 Tax=Aphis glycines TaxID=307491 RepID=A0A6G0T108_APHGL|nr:hypothetical protein AGLY_015682 [Aphis glycines]